MSLLFDAPLIPGLAYREQAISEAEEEALVENLVAADLSPFRRLSLAAARVALAAAALPRASARSDADKGRRTITDTPEVGGFIQGRPPLDLS